MSRNFFWSAPLGALLCLASACGPADAPGELDTNTRAEESREQDSGASGEQLNTVKQAATGSRSDETATLIVGEGHWGDWSAPVYCNPGAYAIGYQMRVEPDQGTNRDDTALNAVSLHCAYKNTAANEWITPHAGIFGNWGQAIDCSGPNNFLTSSQMRIEANRGSNRDDTAANDVTFGCYYGGQINAGNGTQWGDWGSWNYCPADSAICGLSVRVEPNQGSNRDDTGMNGLKVFCCRL